MLSAVRQEGLKLSKFKVGQEVIFSEGDLKEVTGVVHNPFWQESQSDWPEVVIDYNDGENTSRILVDIDKVRPAVDPYEYGVTWKMPDSEEFYPIFSGEWTTLEEVQEGLRGYGSNFRGTKIVRRLKAGEPEDYNV